MIPTTPGWAQGVLQSGMLFTKVNFCLKFSVRIYDLEFVYKND